MSKYQNALDNLYDEAMISSAEETLINECKDTLQELVDKEKPMLVTDIHVDEFYCPKCHSEITHSKCDIESRPSYCENCGQKLDWSDEE